MNVTILEASLHQLMLKVAELAREGYFVERASQVGWMYEVIMSTTEPEPEVAPKEKLSVADRMKKAREAKAEKSE